MKKHLWFAVPAILIAAQVHAQAAPAAPAAKPAAPVAAPAPKPAAAAAAAPAAAPAAKPAAAVAAPGAAPAPTAAAKPDSSVEWTLDPGHSSVGFTARHLGFSKVDGRFKKFAATIRADPKTAKITTFEATADTASIDTGIDKRDAHLRSEDFFAADKFPQLKLKLKSIRWEGKKLTAKTDLTMRDVTKEITFKGELLGTHLVNFGQGPQQRAGYEATATVSRKDFGLKYSGITEGLAIVADAIDITLAIEMSYTAPAAPTTAAAPAAAAPLAAAPAKPAPAAPATVASAKPTPATPPPAAPMAKPAAAATPAAAPAKPAAAPAAPK